MIVIQRILVAVCLLVAGSAWAQGYVARTLHQPVPGGVAVVALGAGDVAPVAQYDGKPALVMRDSDGQWVALAGIDLKTPTGRHALKMTVGGQATTVDFHVQPK